MAQYVKKKYNNLTDAMKDLQYTKKQLKDCAIELTASIKDRFGKNNNEIVGKPLKQSTIARKLGVNKNRKLVDKGKLRDNLKYFISNGTIRVGYKAGFYRDLAKIHNEGLGKMPKRPFLFINDRNLKVIKLYLIPKVK